jgi:hypothetical protein
MTRGGLRQVATLALGIAAFALVSIVARQAAAHTLGLSRGEYTPDGSRLRTAVTLRADDAALAVPGLDADGDGRVTDAELERGRIALQAAFVDALGVESDGARCVGTLASAKTDPPDGVRIAATYECTRAPGRLRLHFGFLDRMPSDHRHLATVHLARGDVDDLLILARPDLEVEASAPSSHGFASLLRAGVEHILTGGDHLAFLLALVLGATLLPAPTGSGKRARVASLLAMLTAFTVGHSAALAVATLGGFAPGPRWVEPAVALSVAYVGAENLWARGARRRWMLTLPFGFVGVEGGQLLVLAVLLPPLALVGSRPWFPRAARFVSALIVVAGVAWFFQRVA